MERICSVDDILGTFWKLHTQNESNSSDQAAVGAAEIGSSAGMNRSASEWAFHEFLKEHLVNPPLKEENTQESADNEDKVSDLPAKLFSINEESGNPEETEETEDDPSKNKPATDLNPLFSGLGDGNGPPVDAKQYEVYLKHRLDLACAAFALSRASNTANPVTTSDDSPLGIPALPPKPEVAPENNPLPVVTSGLPVVTSGSSREHSEDDEADTDLSTLDSSDPNVVKRMRRMLSNRESARRSRRRKQAQMSDLEMQVAQLRVENSSLLKKLNEVNKNYGEAAVDNRVLKSDVEALRAKVKMAEDLVARAASNGPSNNASKQQQQHGSKMNRTPSMQRVASLEHLQKRIRGTSTCNSNQWEGTNKPDNV